MAPDEWIDLCRKALQLTSGSFRKELFASTEAQSIPSMREVLLAINNRAETTRKLRGLVSEIAELSDHVHVDEDLDTSLGRILTLSRQMLETDAAFVMEHDEEAGTASIVLSSGVWTAEFQESQPTGGGLFFAIMGVDAPLQVANYVRDKSFEHEPELDQCTKREGMRAALGIPMHAPDAPFRVLFVADRHERVYHTGDIYILEQLAIQASAVCSLFHQRVQSETLLTDTTRERNEVRCRMDAAVRHAEALEKLIKLVGEPFPETQVAAYLCECVGARVQICSTERLEALEQRGKVTADSKMRIADYLADTQKPGEGRFVGTRDERLFVAAITYENAVWGAIIVDGEIDPMGQRLVNAASGMLSIGDALGVEGAARRHVEASQTFFALVNFGVGHLTERQRALLASKSMTKRSEGHLAILEGDGAVIPALAEKIRGMASGKVLIGVSQEQIGLYGEGDRVPTLLRMISSTVNLNAKGVTGYLSPVVHDANEAPERYRQSEHFLRVIKSLRLKSETGWFTAASIPQSLQLLSQMSAEQRRALVRESIGPLIDYDEERNAELVTTARALVEHQFSASAVAEVLYVHVNTVRHRMRRIEELLGPDWNVGLRLLDFQLALSSIAVHGER